MASTTLEPLATIEMEDFDTTTNEAASAPPRRPTFLILLSCSILQLPIWGMAMNFGIFQDAYTNQNVVKGPRSATGVIGTTMNGVMYLSMPILSTALEHGHWSSYRKSTAIFGACLSSAAFLLSSWSTEVWHLVVLQGLVAALGNALMYAPTVLWLDEWFKDGNRATAYGWQFSVKNIIGTAGPFLLSALLEKLGFRTTLRIWAALVFSIGIAGILLTPQPPAPSTSRRRQAIPWTFLKHRTFYIYAIANALFSSGYGLPQTYLPTYAAQILHLPSAQSTLQIAIFNAPGIISSTGFGLLSDRFHVSATTNTGISALGSAAAVFFLWALKSNTVPGLLIAFSITFGFFASGYSATWGGWIKDLEKEAAERNEALSSGVVYGFFNGARGLGYVAGGFSGVELLELGAVVESARWALGTRYGALMLFTGLSSVAGGVGCFLEGLWEGFETWWVSFVVAVGAFAQGASRLHDVNVAQRRSALAGYL